VLPPVSALNVGRAHFPQGGAVFPIERICAKILMAVQVTERFPESELDITTMFHIFDIDPFVHMRPEHVSTYGEQEIVDLLEMLSRKNNGTHQFYCREPFISLGNEKQLVFDRVCAARDTCTELQNSTRRHD
jgi:hypothetical protein